MQLPLDRCDLRVQKRVRSGKGGGGDEQQTAWLESSASEAVAVTQAAAITRLVLASRPNVGQEEVVATPLGDAELRESAGADPPQPGQLLLHGSLEPRGDAHGEEDREIGSQEHGDDRGSVRETEETPGRLLASDIGEAGSGHERVEIADQEDADGADEDASE